MRWLLRQMLVYVGGLALFYIIWKIMLMVQSVEVGSNQGLNEMVFGIPTIISAIPATIRSVGMFLVEWNVIEHGWTVYGLLNVVFLVVLLIVMVIAIINSGVYRKPFHMVVLIVAFCVIPFVACMWRFVTVGINYRSMMLGGLVCLYVLLGVMAERFLPCKWSNVIGLLLSIIIFNNGIIANISYYYMNQCYEKTYATGLEMIQRIHLMDVDTNETAVVVVGERVGGVALSTTDHGRSIPMVGQMLETDLLYDDYHTILFLKNTFDPNIHRATPEQRQQIIESDEVSSMGVWPYSDSIKLVDNTVVIKLSD